MEKTKCDMVLMQEYKLTAEMCFVIRLIFNVIDAANSNDSKELIESKAMYNKYFKEEYNVDSFRKTIASLIERKILLKVEIPESLQFVDAEKFEFTQNFLKKFRRFTLEMGRELWDVYPKVGYINEKEVPLTALKTFNSEEELYTYYAKTIGHDESKHREIIKLIKWSKENPNSFVNMNIESFVKGKIWDAIKEFADSGGIGFATKENDFSIWV